MKPQQRRLTAGLLVDARLSYRLKASLALVSHATLVQHVFTDDFLGATGGVYSVGLGLTF